jgi:transitional endoplasmic reticulum ATPase
MEAKSTAGSAAEVLDEDLQLARNGNGEPLHDSTKVGLRSLVERPDAGRWENCASIVLARTPGGEKITLWKAVCEIDAAFPRTAERDQYEVRVWERVPSADMIRRAIHWATHEGAGGRFRNARTALEVVPPPQPAPRPVQEPESGADPRSPLYTAPKINPDPWSEIDLDARRKTELQRWLSMFKAQHPAAPRGLLLFGPPGTGKTLLARTLARASDADFIAVTIADLKAPNIGGTAQRVRDLWNAARKAPKAIIFVDECEGIFGGRESVESDSFNRELLQEFLAQWEGVLDNSRHVWVIGATNRRERIDHAMVSRFGAELSFALPDAAIRRSILERELRRCLVDYPDVEEIVENTNGFSGRDLRTLAESVARESYDVDADRCKPTHRIFEQHMQAIRKRGNIGVSERSTWDNLILADDTKRQLRIMCEMLRRSEEMKKHNIELPRGLLLYGPPGTGKTEIARTLANESGLNFVAAKSTDFVGSFTGWSGQMTKAIFGRARAESPAILFIDELDKIAPRSEYVGPSHGFTVEVVRSLVEEMEGVQEHEGHVFVIAATNRVDRVDDAILSRLGKMIEIRIPDAAQREAILETRLRGLVLDFELAAGTAEIAAATEGYSGRDLVKLVANAQQRAVMRLLMNRTTDIILRLSDLREELAALARPAS